MKRPIVIFGLSALTLALSGCAVSSTQSSVCSAGDYASTSVGSPQFTVSPGNADITIYPGQTEQIPVSVQAVKGAAGTVQLTGTSTVPGLSVTGSTATIGSTAMVTITASADVASSCFTGAPLIFAAGRPITVSVSDSTGSQVMQVPITIVLENPAFVPAKTNLPVMTITTDAGAPIDSEDNYVNATIALVDPVTPANNYSGTTEIKGHGNSTWAMPKKPYRLNLTDNEPLLGMASDSNWILLANYDDKSMLRNDVSFQISQIFGMAWTPSSAFTELYINGTYQGTYELTEKVEVSKKRLNIGSIDVGDDSGTDLTGGYIGEIDNYYGETFMTTSPIAKLPIGIDDPSAPDATQSAYFTTAMVAAEASMYSSNFTDPNTGWQASWNAPSVVNYFLVEELTGNQDVDDWSSDYFYKPRGDDLFYRGPVWDMDITLGNDNYGAIQSPTVPWARTQAAWYVQLFKDPAFLAMVKAQWTAIRPQLTALSAYIDTKAQTLTLAAQNNNGRWPTLGEKVFPNPVAEGSYQGEIDYLKSWLTARIAYMDATYVGS